MLPNNLSDWNMKGKLVLQQCEENYLIIKTLLRETPYYVAAPNLLPKILSTQEISLKTL